MFTASPPTTRRTNIKLQDITVNLVAFCATIAEQIATVKPRDKGSGKDMLARGDLMVPAHLLERDAA